MSYVGRQKKINGSWEGSKVALCLVQWGIHGLAL